MKSSCRSLKLSIVLGVFFIISTIILSILSLKCSNEVIDIILNISIGLLGSTMVALLLNIPAYDVSKSQLLERFWHESRRLISRFSKIDYLFNEYNEENIVKYINALNNKKWTEVYNQLTPENKIDCKEKQYKKLLVDEYILNNPDLESKISKSGLKTFANEQVDKYIEKFRKKAEIVFKQYINLAKESTKEMNFMLGDMQFLSGNKPYEKIHKKMYQPLFDMLDKIKEQSYHFNLYLEGHGNEAVCIEKLFELQKQLFKLKIEENETVKNYTVMGTFNDNMLINLEEFRADMYNIEPEKQNIHPILFKSHKKR